jgi:hypothetical protein
MKPSIVLGIFAALLCFFAFSPYAGVEVYGRDSGKHSTLPEGIYLELTKDFYEALRDEGGRGAKVYSNDPSAGYLKEIAVSSRFMVQTNLEILRQQEAMNQMLRRLLEKK